MKKLSALIIMIVAVFTLAACSDVTSDVERTVLSSEETLASMGYLSAGFLGVSANTDTTMNQFTFLDNHEETEIEGTLDEVNMYMELLKEFVNNGTQTFGNVSTTLSPLEAYELLIEVNVNEQIFEIHYNVDEVTNELSGIIIIDSVEYTFEGQNSLIDSDELDDDDEADLDDDEADLDDDEDEADLDDEDEADLDDEDEDEEEFEQSMTIIARNGDDTVTIDYEIERETEEGVTESEVRFEIITIIDGIEKEIAIEIEKEIDEYEIIIQDGDNEYKFSREIEDDEIEYELEYEVNGIDGEIKITETVNEAGETVYEYEIDEDGVQKSVERDQVDFEYDDDDDEDEEDDEEDTTSDSTTSNEA